MSTVSKNHKKQFKEKKILKLHVYGSVEKWENGQEGLDLYK